ncbi:MAG: NUDIX hydrolase [Gammaproteobacteria bacterium]|nr:NUDIX hydrolase [Gammaproteobacteria bacterium]
MNDWVTLINKIKAISQIGKAYSKDPFDTDRYDQLSLIANEMYSKISNEKLETIENFFFPDKGYATAKVDLRAGIIKDDKILLVKERRDGKWALPGGWSDVGETPKEGIVREVEEETGFLVKVNRLISIRDQSIGEYSPRYPVHVYKIFFLCDIVDGTAKNNIEISDVSFFPFDSLPELSVGTTLNRDIHDIKEYYNNSMKLPICE